MAEAIALLVESLGALVAALVELLAICIEAVAVFLGLMTQSLAEPRQDKSASRASRRAQRWAGALLLSGSFAAIGFGLYWAIGRPSQLRADARELVSREARRLVNLVDDRGRLVPDANAPQEIDPWGRPVTRTYSKTRVAESVEVRSFGPDGQVGTPDDIAATESTLLPVGDIAKEGLKKAADKLLKRK